MIHRRDEHIPFRWLAERADGRDSDEKREEAESHVAACEACARRLGAVRSLVALIGAGPLESPPESLDRIVRRAFDDAAESADASLSAFLVFDQAEDFACALRAAPGDGRRLLWTLGPWEVDATVVPSGPGFDMLAQFLPLGPGDEGVAAGSVRLYRGRRQEAETSIAGTGRFTLRGLRAGIYRIVGTIGGRDFAFPALRIG